MSLNSIPAFLGALLAILIGLFVLFKNPKSFVNFAFSLFCLSLFGWLFGYAIVYSAKDTTIAMFGTRIACAFAAFTAPAFYHLTVSFLNKRNEYKYVYFSYLIIFIIFLMFIFSNYLLEEPYKYSWGYYSHANRMFHPFYLVIFFGIFLRGFYLLFRKYLNRKSFSPIEATRIVYIFVAYLVALLGSVDYIQKYGIDLYPFGWLFEMCFAIIIAYAITKAELMDIRVVITRAAAYLFVGVLLAASFVGLNSFALPQAAVMVANTLLALFWALAAHRLRALIQTPLEEKWITDWFDSDKLINHIATKLIPVMDRAGVFNIIAGELKAAVKIKDIKIAIGPQGTNYQDLTRAKEGLVMPLSSSEGLEGILTLGPKISEDPYNDKELTVFRTIMVQVRAIFDRVRPYERIKRDYDANQKKLYDTERLLARSEKIASMANLVQEYNHQVKTPLAIIRGRIETLFDKTRDEEYLKKMQALLLEQVDRANYIVESTLRLSRPHERQETLLDLGQEIEEALRLFPPSGVSVVKDLAPGLVIRGDREDLETVFINLFKNAVEAMSKGGELRITTCAGEENGAPIVRAEVADTGVGIPPENMEKIFEPFFSTSVTKGRGLGLSIVFRIMREHLGSVEVKSQPGQGTKFILKFPAKN
ncbi:MAG: ATP-binding protein [Candidatus Margulisiibacteriota bacterium]